MAPSAADQDPKATHGSGELPSETASPEKRQAPLTAGSTSPDWRALAFSF